jgi:hypothetical protein
LAEWFCTCEFMCARNLRLDAAAVNAQRVSEC